jgi:hypothetical protein
MLPAPPADYLLLTLIAVLCHGLLHGHAATHRSYQSAEVDAAEVR